MGEHQSLAGGGKFWDRQRVGQPSNGKDREQPFAKGIPFGIADHLAKRLPEERDFADGASNPNASAKPDTGCGTDTNARPDTATAACADAQPGANSTPGVTTTCTTPGAAADADADT